MKNIKDVIVPGKGMVKWFQLLKGHHPILYRVFSILIVSLFVIIIVLTSVFGFIDYHAYMEDGDGNIDVSTAEAANTLTTRDILDNAGMGSYFYTPVTWRLESLNPVGSVEVGDIKAEYNFTQNYNNLKVTFNGFVNNDTQETGDIEILQQLVENATNLQVEITTYGDLYGAIDGETVVTGTVSDCVMENKRFKLNVYFRALEYADVQEIITCFEDRNSPDSERYVLRELNDISSRDLSIRLDSGRLLPYHGLKAEPGMGTVYEYIHGVLERELVEPPCGFDIWYDSDDNSRRLQEAGPSEFLEIIEEFTSIQLSKEENVNCMDYTYLYYDAFYAAKNRSNNPSVKNLHVFTIRSSRIIPGYLTDEGHVYIGIMLTGGTNMQISFVDPHWADRDFPSLLHLFMHNRQERFDAYDRYHHIRVPESEFLLEKQIESKRNTLFTSMGIIALFSFFTVYFLYIFKSVSKLETDHYS